MSSVMSMSLNRSSVFRAPVARQFANFYPSLRVEFSPKETQSYSFGKSTTSKQLKRVVATALNQSSDSPVGKFRDAAISPKIVHEFWGDFFLAYEATEPLSEEQEQELNRLREEILMMLKTTPDGSFLKLDLIDNIQRLGVSYHFEDEIEESLSNLNNYYNEETQNDIHAVALRFRLLRQQGHYVSTDVLKKFLKKDGEFDQAYLANDVKGLLSLYEASHYRVHGEDILDEALILTTSILEGMVNNSSGLAADKINLALTWPIRKTLNRVTARIFISLDQQDQSHDEVLLKFAKLDFNRVQRIYQQEICAITKLWKGMDCAKNYPFVRDRLVENYFAMAGLVFEPKYCLERKIMTILANAFTVIDDIYDEYGNIDELLLLTNAFERWNIDVVNQLPPYLRPCYEFTLKSYAEFEEELGKHDRADMLEYVKAEVKGYANSSYKAAYQHHIGYIPTFEEYLENAIISNGIYLMMTASYMGTDDLVTKAVLDWTASRPLAYRAASTISRLTDDMHDSTLSVTGRATAVECLMNQYGLPMVEAVKEIEKHVSKAWKDLNTACLLPAAVPLKILERPLNHAVMMSTIYKYGDGFTVHDSNTVQLLRSFLIDPII